MSQGPAVQAEDAVERTCIVSRQAGEPRSLIRFVADPQGRVVADIREKLPGRGAWVTAGRQFVEQAVARRLFSRALKRDVDVSPALADEVDALLESDALSALAMSRKAGLAHPGSDRAHAALRSGEAKSVLSATDAADDGIRKLHAAAQAGGGNVEFLKVFDSRQIGAIFGRDALTHVALAGGGATAAALGAIRRLLAYRGG
jgi:hypothetical protein